MTLIGWMWFGLGVLAFISGLGGLMMSSLMDVLRANPPKNTAPLDGIWNYYRQAAVVQVVLALFTAFTAYNFVRRKPWARIGIQFFSVLTGLWFVGFGIFWVCTTSSLAAAPGSEQVATAARIFMSVAGGVMMTALATVFGFCAWFIGRPAVKDEFQPANQAKAGS
ncbi:hypothetical protein [Roseimicrobium gellanilyticum]|uniref:hypothetical protein n=1 Tax=Roseimicrobium gellanilyticum TaxID=748857 RepID=UPI001B87AC2E|nr:hypothetical protein [Roseimicrobium gellanilyticum]